MHNLLLFLPFSIIFLLITPSSSHLSPNHSPSFTKLYAFGDSFTDTGNTQFAPSRFSATRASIPPYGTTFFHHPTSRYSDGRLVIDFLSAALSLPFLPPYLLPSSNSSCHGVNFAVAFSTSFDEQFLTQNFSFAADRMPAMLSKQVKWFDRYLEEKMCRGDGPPECGGDAMDGALFWIGHSGFSDYMMGMSDAIPAEVIRLQSVHSVINLLRAILEKGAKHVFVQGVPPMGCLPILLSLPRFYDNRDINGCNSEINAEVEAHNSLLEENLQKLRQLFPDAFISYVDIFAAHLSVVKEFKSKGFNEPFTVCCGAGGPPYNFNISSMCGMPGATVSCSQPSKYVNWDGIHVTEAMNKRMAEMFFHGDQCRPPLSEAFVKSNGM